MTEPVPSRSLQKLPVFSTDKLPLNENYNPQRVTSTGPLWKDRVVTGPAVVDKKFPWWIPAVGVPVLGVGAYLLLKDENQKKKKERKKLLLL